MAQPRLVAIAKSVRAVARELLLTGQEFDRRRSSIIVAATSGAFGLAALPIAATYLPAPNYTLLVVPTTIVFMGLGSLVARLPRFRDTRDDSDEERIRKLSVAHQILIEHWNELPPGTAKRTRDSLSLQIERINEAIADVAVKGAGATVGIAESRAEPSTLSSRNFTSPP